MLVILNPSPFVTLSEAKGLIHRLRINSVKNLTQSVILNGVKDLGSSFALAQDKLRLTPQNDITAQSLKGGEGGLYGYIKNSATLRLYSLGSRVFTIVLLKSRVPSSTSLRSTTSVFL